MFEKICLKKLLKNILIISILILLAYLIINISKFNYNKTYGNLKSGELVDMKVSEELEEEVIKSQEYEIPIKVDSSVPIFMYHFVSEDTGNNPYPENVVRPSDLEEQLKYLKENNYETIYITELPHLEKYAKPVALTFDDGFADFYYNAYPLLKKYNIKASLYVVKEFESKPGYCNIEQLREMKESGLVDIQSHTVNHYRLATLKRSEIEYEISEQKENLREKLDINSDVLCYPYGSYNDTVISETKKYYKFALAMDGGVYYSSKHNYYEIPRIYANRSMKISEFISYCKNSNVKVEYKRN